ncbi:Trigger factor [Candidatus Desulfarcum epimagneticum]|uniref:Trigger factor n=1 Tax=uncultured Desulfobacteraceae bacterium TaxID=218296 RepID=A0A484HDS8_9BACT|nr:Trigger factor [uncultured Desulfobacteraceae bacterium]
MRFTVEDNSSVRKTLHIEIPKEKVAEEAGEAYESLKKTVKLKGFRPGKAPRTVLKSIYKKKIAEQVSSKLVNDTLQRIFSESDLKIAGVHDVSSPELDEDAAYSFDAVLDVFPEIGDIDFKGVKIRKNLYEVTEEDIQGQLKMLQKHAAQNVKVEEDRPLETGDIAIIDYEGFKDGRPFNKTQRTENFTCEPGDGKMHPDFEEKIIGMTPGESREIEINFASDYPDGELAGLDIVFHVTLNEIRQRILPEMNDEMAKNFGPFETLADLEKQISDNLAKGYKKRIEQELNEDVFQGLIERTDFELPEASVDNELESILREAEQSFASREMSLEDAGLTREGLAEKYRDTARKKVRRFMLLNKIIEQEKLELSDEDLEKGFQEMAEGMGYPAEQIKAQYAQNESGLSFFKRTLLEKSVLKLIMEHGETIETKPEQEVSGDEE